MRCVSCHGLSLVVICQGCHKKLLSPTITKRKVGTLEVVSLFKYSTIEPFLLTKHTASGFRIYKYFSKQFIRPFITKFAAEIDEYVTMIAIDEQVRSGYSHTAVLSHYAKSPKILTSHASLLAQNSISYAGKTLQYRLDHPRDFSYTGKREVEAILIDDIVTTGVTLQEAQIELSRHGVEVLFALTLADARD
ncbi:MAG: ComF family protein [Sulfurovum sp.]|nr:ComF family protein [Sulfurovum sp.]